MLVWQEWAGWRLAGRNGLPDGAVAAVLAASEALRAIPDERITHVYRSSPPSASTLLDSADGITRLGAVHDCIRRITGLSLRANQVQCALRLLRGDCVELRTGEGKTLAASLAALAAASVGVPVHVVTVNDYLVQRDHDLIAPIAQRLGLTTAVVLQAMEDDDKRRAYDADIVYGSNKTFVFDALRDRREGRDQKRRAVPRQAGQVFAIVDEADSVLIDDATVPMILSEPLSGVMEADAVLFEALVAFARACQPDRDRRRDGAGTWRLTVAGVDRLAQTALLWSHPAARSDDLIGLAETALAACHAYHEGAHYILRDGVVVMVDQATGRLMPDRKWAYGMHQMIEVKHDIPPSPEARTVGQVTQQTYFRQYLHLAGLTGTARECQPEFWAIYRLSVCPVAPHVPSRLANLGLRLHRTADSKWRAVARRAMDVAATRAVLVGVNDVAESAALHTALVAEGAEDVAVLDALTEAEEAAIVAQAGQRGRITVATHLAGRGTDIALSPEVFAAGGLHVILASFFASGRLERQLVGRAGRKGDPGSHELHVSLQDRGLTDGVPPIQRLVLVVALWLRFWPRTVITLLQKVQDSRARKLRRKSLLREQDLAERLGYR
jgi:preprotein translocase subunit SecA